jgi:hypothetical protein
MSKKHDDIIKLVPLSPEQVKERKKNDPWQTYTTTKKQKSKHRGNK